VSNGLVKPDEALGVTRDWGSLNSTSRRHSAGFRNWLWRWRWWCSGV